MAILPTPPLEDTNAVDQTDKTKLNKQVADMQRFTELYKNPAINVAITFIEPLPVGVVIALVSAGILRRRPQRRSPAEGVAVAM